MPFCSFFPGSAVGLLDRSMSLFKQHTMRVKTAPVPRKLTVTHPNLCGKNRSQLDSVGNIVLLPFLCVCMSVSVCV